MFLLFINGVEVLDSEQPGGRDAEADKEGEDAMRGRFRSVPYHGCGLTHLPNFGVERQTKLHYFRQRQKDCDDVEQNHHACAEVVHFQLLHAVSTYAWIDEIPVVIEWSALEQRCQ